ncbi:MAG: GNAT family N-acetyltransferase [Acidobacteria bacterium]|nr:GNAT family N-acetyltransferase [Acidobacteriota bacterium]
MESKRMDARQPQRKKRQDIVVRALTVDDIDAIIEIDANVMGEAKPEYWRRKLALYLAGQDLQAITTAANEYFVGIDPQLARVAEVNGRVVGFMIGEIRSWEFHQPPTGWITAMGVDAAYQRQGIGRRLLAEVLDCFREKKLENVCTMVEWSDGEVLSFFTAMGFDRGSFIELEKKLSL